MPTFDQDSEQKEPSLEKGKVVVLALFLFALALRLVGLNWGLPTQTHWYSYHPDEAQMLSAIASLDFFNGDFNPNFFNYPSLYIYLAALCHLVASGLGLLGQSPSQNWMVAHDVLLCARVVAATLGAATVPLVFLIARQIGGWKTGILAALLLALAPGHVQHSHFATVDVPATFFVTLCVWLSVRGLRENAETRWVAKQLLLASFVAGLATATKYNAVLALIAPMAACFYLARKKTISFMVLPATIGVTVIAFLIACPYSVLDFPAFWGDSQNAGVAYELLVHPKQGSGDVFISTGSGWMYHLIFNAPFLLTLPVLLAALPGLAATLKARRTSQPAIILMIWCALYFFALGFSQVRFLRYLLPIAPTLCVFAACGVLALPRFGSTAKRAVGACLLLVAAWGTRDVLYQFVVIDPRDGAAQWMASQSGSSATVGMIESPWFFSPPLSPVDSPPYRRFLALQLSQFSGGKYQFIVTGFDTQKLKTDKPQWFVTSEFEWREKARLQDADFQKFQTALEADYAVVARFKNIAPFALPGRDFVPHDFLYPNPEIRIYKKR